MSPRRVRRGHTTVSLQAAVAAISRVNFRFCQFVFHFSFLIFFGFLFWIFSYPGGGRRDVAGEEQTEPVHLPKLLITESSGPRTRRTRRGDRGRRGRRPRRALVASLISTKTARPGTPPARKCLPPHALANPTAAPNCKNK